MADNPSVPWLPQPIAADDVAGIFVQRLKLQLGADGAAADAPGDAANGLDVDVTRVQGTVNVAVTGTPTVALSGTPNVAISGTPNVAVPAPVFTDPVAVSSATINRIAASAGSVTLAAANVNRRGLIVFNDSANANLLIKYGSGASATSFTVRVLPGGFWEMPRPVFTGLVAGIWENATPTGAAQVTEV